MSAATDATDGNGWVGRAMRRKEDPRMITGEGTYVDDIDAPRGRATRRSCARPRPMRALSASTPRRRRRATT